MTGGAKVPKQVDLVLLAGEAGSREELYFTIVNRTFAAVSYDRASVWTGEARPHVVAVSGAEAAEPRGWFATVWSGVLAGLGDRSAPCRFGPNTDAVRERWEELAGRTDGLDALWAPLPGGAGVLFERWGGAVFTLDEAESLEKLVRAYGVVGLRRGYGRGRRRRRAAWLGGFVAVMLALALIRVPLRVVAQCEVTARNPRLVAAPMDGVIDEVLVAPGQRVGAGEALARYDSRLLEEELNISRRQVEVVETELASAKARGFLDARFRGETAILEARLRRELARLDALEAQYARRVVTAPAEVTEGGMMVQLDNARAWRGRPVATGQAILWLVDPEDSRVALWLPQDDRIRLDPERPVAVHLHALGGGVRLARLTYMSSYAQPMSGGIHAFPAEAEWLADAPPPPLGLRGSAVLYGEKVSLGYWLFRRPAAWVRRWLGV